MALTAAVDREEDVGSLCLNRSKWLMCSQVQGGGSYRARWEITSALIKMFIVWVDVHGLVVKS